MNKRYVNYTHLNFIQQYIDIDSKLNDISL